MPFSPETTLRVLARYPITTLCAPPTAYRQLVTLHMQKLIETHPPKALSVCVGGGEPLNPGVIQCWKGMTGVDIRDGTQLCSVPMAIALVLMDYTSRIWPDRDRSLGLHQYRHASQTRQYGQTGPWHSRGNNQRPWSALSGRPRRRHSRARD